eukprot:2726860-Prorocentrum_lima.AAC.1
MLGTSLDCLKKVVKNWRSGLSLLAATMASQQCSLSPLPPWPHVVVVLEVVVVVVVGGGGGGVSVSYTHLRAHETR